MSRPNRPDDDDMLAVCPDATPRVVEYRATPDSPDAGALITRRGGVEDDMGCCRVPAGPNRLIPKIICTSGMATMVPATAAGTTNLANDYTALSGLIRVRSGSA